MTVSTRHIRDKFYTWFDVGVTKTPKALCGVRTREGLIGIPTVTEQAQVVQRGDKLIWGWCTRCCYAAYRQISGLDLHAITNTDIRLQYKRFYGVIEGPAKAYAKIAQKEFEPLDLTPHKPAGYKTKDQMEYDTPVCYLCQVRPATIIDHIVPKSRGGSNHIKNLGPACHPCNQKKSDMSVEEVIDSFPDVRFPDYFIVPVDVVTA